MMFKYFSYAMGVCFMGGGNQNLPFFLGELPTFR